MQNKYIIIHVFSNSHKFKLTIFSIHYYLCTEFSLNQSHIVNNNLNTAPYSKFEAFSSHYSHHFDKLSKSAIYFLEKEDEGENISTHERLTLFFFLAFLSHICSIYILYSEKKIFTKMHKLKDFEVGII